MTSVYFIRVGKAGPIKIGVAVDVFARAAALQCGNPHRLTIVATVPGEGETLETDLHRLFSSERMMGEWFRPTPRLTQYIREKATPWTGRQIASRDADAELRIPLNITLPPLLNSKLSDVARFDGIPASRIIERLLRNYVRKA